MDDLVAFVTAQLDEDEAAANEVHRPGTCGCVDRDGDFSPDPVWCGCGYPARVLREVAAKRAIVGLHAVHAEPERWGDSHSDPALRGQPTGRTSYWCAICDDDRDYGHVGGPQEGCETLRHVAAVWSDHAGYRPEWKP